MPLKHRGVWDPNADDRKKKIKTLKIGSKISSQPKKNVRSRSNNQTSSNNENLQISVTKLECNQVQLHELPVLANLDSEIPVRSSLTKVILTGEKTAILKENDPLSTNKRSESPKKSQNSQKQAKKNLSSRTSQSSGESSSSKKINSNVSKIKNPKSSGPNSSAKSEPSKKSPIKVSAPPNSPTQLENSELKHTTENHHPLKKPRNTFKFNEVPKLKSENLKKRTSPVLPFAVTCSCDLCTENFPAKNATFDFNQEYQDQPIEIILPEEETDDSEHLSTSGASIEILQDVQTISSFSIVESIGSSSSVIIEVPSDDAELKSEEKNIIEESLDSFCETEVTESQPKKAAKSPESILLKVVRPPSENVPARKGVYARFFRERVNSVSKQSNGNAYTKDKKDLTAVDYVTSGKQVQFELIQCPCTCESCICTGHSGDEEHKLTTNVSVQCSNIDNAENQWRKLDVICKKVGPVGSITNFHCSTIGTPVQSFNACDFDNSNELITSWSDSDLDVDITEFLAEICSQDSKEICEFSKNLPDVGSSVQEQVIRDHIYERDTPVATPIEQKSEDNECLPKNIKKNITFVTNEKNDKSKGTPKSEAEPSKAGSYMDKFNELTSLLTSCKTLVTGLPHISCSTTECNCKNVFVESQIISIQDLILSLLMEKINAPTISFGEHTEESATSGDKTCENKSGFSWSKLTNLFSGNLNTESNDNAKQDTTHDDSCENTKNVTKEKNDMNVKGVSLGYKEAQKNRKARTRTPERSESPYWNPEYIALKKYNQLSIQKAANRPFISNNVSRVTTYSAGAERNANSFQEMGRPSTVQKSQIKNNEKPKYERSKKTTVTKSRNNSVERPVGDKNSEPVNVPVVVPVPEPSPESVSLLEKLKLLLRGTALRNDNANSKKDKKERDKEDSAELGDHIKGAPLHLACSVQDCNCSNVHNDVKNSYLSKPLSIHSKHNLNRDLDKGFSEVKVFTDQLYHSAVTKDNFPVNKDQKVSFTSLIRNLSDINKHLKGNQQDNNLLQKSILLKAVNAALTSLQNLTPEQLAQLNHQLTDGIPLHPDQVTQSLNEIENNLNGGNDSKAMSDEDAVVTQTAALTFSVGVVLGIIAFIQNT